MPILFTSDKNASVDHVSSAFSVQREMMELPHDLMGDAPAMRNAGERYVERGVDESDVSFENRIKRPRLLDAFKYTVKALRGQVFQEPVVLGDDASERFIAWSEDVDNMGHNLSMWSANMFERGIIDGVTFTLVDYSKINIRDNNGVTEYYDEASDTWKIKTLASDAENGWNPYLVNIPAANVLDCWVDSSRGRFGITHFRYIEQSLESDGTEFGRELVTRIRLLTPEYWRVWVKHEGDESFIIESDGKMTLGVVPVVMFMPGEKITDCTAMPALYNLAEINRRHWAASCGDCELMEYIRRPVYFGRMLGNGTDDDIVFGAGDIVLSGDPSGNLTSVGVDPSSALNSRQELLDLQSEMAAYGFQLTQPRSGTMTATEVVRDSIESNSALSFWAQLFQDSLENILRIVAMWWGEDDGASVKVKTDFAPDVGEDFILTLYRSGVISLETAQNILKSSGILPDDFVPEDEIAKLARGTMLNGSNGAVKRLADALSKEV